MTPRPAPGRARLVVVVGLLVLLVNLPVVHSTVTGAQVDRRGVLVGVTLGIDALLALAVWLVLRYAAAVRPMDAVALSDVGRCAPGGALERIDALRWELRGEVVEVGDDRIVIDTGERQVGVRLDGHLNPVGHQQAARVEVRLAP